ncbi:MAG: hypothetical protein J6U54_01580 [Clostridiales bacterium]|nr:hypothetical protein [Clostridiales bacterium]
MMVIEIEKVISFMVNEMIEDNKIKKGVFRSPFQLKAEGRSEAYSKVIDFVNKNCRKENSDKVEA